MRKEEVERKQLSEKARLLEKSWSLNRECRRFLRNVNTWEERENKEAHAKDEKRKEQIQKVIWKKNEFQNKQEIKKKKKLITDMLEKLSKVAAQKIEEDMRKEERKELQVMKRNIWKRWRGKNGIKEREN